MVRGPADPDNVARPLAVPLPAPGQTTPALAPPVEGSRFPRPGPLVPHRVGGTVPKWTVSETLSLRHPAGRVKTHATSSQTAMPRDG